MIPFEKYLVDNGWKLTAGEDRDFNTLDNPMKIYCNPEGVEYIFTVRGKIIHRKQFKERITEQVIEEIPFGVVSPGGRLYHAPVDNFEQWINDNP